MKWLEHITVLESGKVCYRGKEIELTCANIINIAHQESHSGIINTEISEIIRDIKIEILLSKR